MKKGQLTIFVIVIIFLLLASALIIYLRQERSDDQTPGLINWARKSSEIKLYAQQDVVAMMQQEFDLNSMNDFVFTPQNAKCQELEIFYAYCDGSIAQLDRADIEAQLKKQALQQVSQMHLDVPGYDCTVDTSNAFVVLEPGEDYILFHINNLKAVCEGFTDNFDVTTTMDTKFNKVLDVAQLIIQNQLKDLNSIDTSFLIDVGDRNDVKIKIVALDSKTVVYKIRHLTEDTTLEFNVGVRL